MPTKLKIIQHGYILPFRSKPPLSRCPTIISGYRDVVKDTALTGVIQDLVEKRAIQLVRNQHSIGYYSRLFLVPKPGNKWRPVIDLSHLNTFLDVQKFKMETPESIRSSLCQGEWVTSIDLQDAYFHVPIHPLHYKYLRFAHRGKVYQFVALPFGLATAPSVFTLLAKEVKLMALNRGIRVHMYLDDWLIRAQSVEQSKLHTQEMVSLAESLGWLINQSKSELVPTQLFEFVGYKYNLSEALVLPTPDRWNKLSSMVQVLSQRPVISARELMSLIGLLASTEKMVPWGRLHMRPLQWHLKRNWRFPQSLETKIPWGDSIKSQLRWWSDPNNVLKGSPLHPRDHEVLMYTDASNDGWGGQLGDLSAKGLWSQSEKGLHINLLELKAVLLALKAFKNQCIGREVLVATDNTSVVAYVNKQGGTRSAQMCALLWRLMSWCNLNQVSLRARHVPGRLNVLADALSRSNQIQSTEWSLHPDVVTNLCKRWFTPNLDLFATRHNHKFPVFVSPVPDPKAWAVDALHLDWSGLIAYAYPPTALIPQVVQRLYRFQCQLVLIAPGWPGMSWFWDLVHLSLEIPLHLPVFPRLLKQPTSPVFHDNPEYLNLHAWCLGVNYSNNKASLKKWQRELLRLKGPPQGPSTNQSGASLFDGVRNIQWKSPECL